MSEQVCQNPNCKSQGQPHPNCRCHGGMASGGMVEAFCSTGRPHERACEYFADGGMAGQGFIPDSEFKPDAQTAPAEAPAGSASGFIPDEQFVSDEEKYGSPLEMAKTFGEGLASSATFGLSKGVEKSLGVKPEDMRLREENNPIIHGAGEVGGLLLPGGAGKAMGMAGKAVASAAGLTGIGGVAAKLATEGALYQSGNELAKMFSEDPNQTMQTALAHVGLSAVIAPAIGVPLEGASALWDASVGKKLAPYLQAVKERAGVGAEAEAAPIAARANRIDPFTKKPIVGELADAIPVTPRSGPRIDPFTKKPIEAVAEEAAGAVDPLLDRAKGTIEKLFDKGARHAASALLVGSGHHYLGALNELTGKFFTNAVEDAGKVAWSRFLTKAESNPAAFKAMLDAANAAAKGLQQIGKGARVAVSGAGAEASTELSDKQVKKLEDAAEEYRLDPSKFMNIGNSLAVYEPAHAAAMASSVARSMDFINQNRPKVDPSGLLDPERVPSKDELSQYRRSLQIVDKPASILNHVANGTLTINDLKTLSQTNPGLHQLMSQKIMDQIIDSKARGKDIPYKTRMSLSLFLGQPLDASMSPQAITANQMVHQRTNQARQQEQQGMGPHSTKGLEKMPGAFLTPQQAREQSKQ